MGLPVEVPVYLGGDPELFIIDEGGKPVPAHRYFPSQPTAEENCLAYYRDGYAVELNLYRFTCREELIGKFRSVVWHVRNELPGFTFSTSPSVDINPLDLSDAPEDVVTTGCRPSHNAYTGVVSPPRLDFSPGGHPSRYAGGHIHISTRNQLTWRGLTHEQAAITQNPFFNKGSTPGLVKLLDLYVGLPHALIMGREELWRRRKYYGRAGEYRPGKHGGFVGLEYRVLPPDMWNRTYFASFFLGLTREVIRRWSFLKPVGPELEGPLQSAINTGDPIGWEILPTLPGWFDERTIERLAEHPNKFAFLPQLSSIEYGFQGYALDQGIPVPPVDDLGYYRS